MSVTVLFLGYAKQKTGKEKVIFPVGGSETLKTFKQKLFFQFPRLAALKSSLGFSINCEWAKENDLVHAGDEIGVIPPISGG